MKNKEKKAAKKTMEKTTENKNDNPAKVIITKLIELWKNSIHIKIITIIFLIVSFLNLLSIQSESFSNWYTKNIFSKISFIFSSITGLFSKSIGEIMIIIGIIFIMLLITICVTSIFVKKIRKIRNVLVIIMFYAILFVYTTETLNCYIMYHTSTIEEELNRKLLELDQHKEEINQTGIKTSTEQKNEIQDYEKLLNLYNNVATKLNNLSDQVKRDSNGDLIDDYTYKECKTALKNVSDQFELLDSKYPNPKKIINSDFMSQQYLAGIYFPFSMEANYNDLMYPSNFPSTICHELSHLKGYIREDEANFIAYVACINSENNFIKYSGYLSVLNYIVKDLYDYLPENEYDQIIKLNDKVAKDNIFLSKEDFDKVEKDSIFSTDVLSDATDAFLDKNLKLNGVQSGMNNYNEVVKLLILYYEIYSE